MNRDNEIITLRRVSRREAIKIGVRIGGAIIAGDAVYNLASLQSDIRPNYSSPQCVASGSDDTDTPATEAACSAQLKSWDRHTNRPTFSWKVPLDVAQFLFGGGALVKGPSLYENLDRRNRKKKFTLILTSPSSPPESH